MLVCFSYLMEYGPFFLDYLGITTAVFVPHGVKELLDIQCIS